MTEDQITRLAKAIVAAERSALQSYDRLAASLVSAVTAVERSQSTLRQVVDLLKTTAGPARVLTTSQALAVQGAVVSLDDAIKADGGMSTLRGALQPVLSSGREGLRAQMADLCRLVDDLAAEDVAAAGAALAASAAEADRFAKACESARSYPARRGY